MGPAWSSLPTPSGGEETDRLDRGHDGEHRADAGADPADQTEATNRSSVRPSSTASPATVTSASHDPTKTLTGSS